MIQLDDLISSTNSDTIVSLTNQIVIYAIRSNDAEVTSLAG